ncbi:MAG TPA: SPOR domain-containing protein [Gammaproteobacteria bacterium]|jgi:cell division septation protein DedD
MEIGLKERLIGAAVLVVLGVIIIPFFIKGSPSPDSTVTQAVSLPATDSTSAQQQVSLPLGSTAAPALPAAATQAPATALAPAPAPAPVLSQPAAKPAVHAIPRAAAPAAPASSAGGKWTVQVGSYGSQANADKVVASLKQHGLHGSVSHFKKAGHTYYRVRVGSYAEHSDADKAAAAVAKAIGGKPQVVSND